MNKKLQAISGAFSVKRNLHRLFVRTNDRMAFLDGYRIEEDIELSSQNSTEARH